MKYELTQIGGRWMWQLKDGDQIVHGDGGFKTEGAARRAVKAFARRVAAAHVVVIKLEEGSSHV